MKDQNPFPMNSSFLEAEITSLPKQLEEYADAYLKLLATNLAQKSVNVGAGAVVAMLIYLPVMIGVLFASGALAWWLGDLLGSRVYGFLLVAGLFLFLAIIVALTRKKLLLPWLRNILVRIIYSEK